MSKQMQPGAELNALVHLKLFGITARPAWCPGYSTSWDGMQLVVEEMQRRGYEFCLTYDECEWSVDFRYLTSSDGTIHNYVAGCKSAPHAVCLAALQALEEDNHA